MKVQFAAEAGACFDDALRRLRLLNHVAAARFMAKVRRQLRRVGQYPRSGNAVPEYGYLPVREFLIDPYRSLSIFLRY
jgi:plasmid stabilization system protein ParE